MIEFIKLKEHMQNNFYPLILVFGQDQWVINRALKFIEDSLNIEYADMNVTYSESNDIATVVQASVTAPFFSKRRLVVARSVENSKLSQATKILTEYVNSSSGSSCLVVVCEKDVATKLGSIANSQIVNCDKLKSSDIAKWVTTTCRRSGATIENGATQLLIDYCMQDMARISSETDKLISYSNEVTAEMVEKLVTRDVEYVVYDLSKVIATKQWDKALDMLSSLSRGSNGMRGLFDMMYNYYRRMYYIRINRDATGAELASNLGVKEGAIRFAKEVANKYKPKQLLTAIELFASADKKIKSFVDESGTMQLLVMQLMNL